MRRLGAAALLAGLIACRPAAPGLTLLFFNRSPVARLGALSWAADPDSSRILGFDDALRVAQVIAGPRLATPVSVASLGHELLITERTGQAVVFDSAGAFVREWDSPFPASVYAASSGTTVAARSPYYVPFEAEPDTAPLLTLLDSLGRVVGRVGTVHMPRVPFFVELANAGAVATDTNGSVYFAPYVRDELSKYDQSGALRWRMSRDRYATESDPALVPSGRTAAARYAIVNYAMALGHGRLYVLGASDSSGTAGRVDVVDTASGALLESRPLGPEETAVALRSDGVVVTFDADSLRVGAAPTGPSAMPSFALPDTAGDTVRLASLRGRVVLVNFWASWCDPCRAEFPNMAALYRDFPREELELVAISDDVARADMLRFIREFRPPFPVLVGAGQMKARYHYRGLPYSVLLDRQGRVIERIFGFGGAEEFAALRAAIAKAVRVP
ncbi:MAG TPA: redoxin domain-containing protein [Gemmatimonadales bacterium]|nr:redoxin domain-containing protein [Gemmatimonadales bacterium]